MFRFNRLDGPDSRLIAVGEQSVTSRSTSEDVTRPELLLIPVLYFNTRLNGSRTVGAM